MSQRPLVYHWIAHYNNGLGFSQFNPLTYKENSFNDIDQNKLIKFGLYPFTRELANGVKMTGTEVIALPFLPKYEIEINSDRRLIYYREVYISHEDYHLCKKCGKEFNYSKNTPKVSSKYSSPICPNCSGHDLFVCKSCNISYKRFEEVPGGMCEKCHGHVQREKITSDQYNRERRWIEYMLGYQYNLNGKNIKFLLKIDERGDSLIL